jgi:hypothetical protein
MASMFGGQVTVVDDPRQVIVRFGAQQPPPPAGDDVRERMRQLVQRFYEARWYGTEARQRQTATKLARRCGRTPRFMVFDSVIKAGDLVRAQGSPHRRA